VNQEAAGAVPARHPTRSLSRIARHLAATQAKRGQYPQGTPHQGVAQPVARLVWGEEVAGAKPAALTSNGAMAEQEGAGLLNRGRGATRACVQSALAPPPSSAPRQVPGERRT
jgi:hypothetical protein